MRAYDDKTAISMKSKRFQEWCLGHFLRGQSELAQTLKILLYKSHPHLFEKLDFECDEQFLEPLFFAWYTQINQYSGAPSNGRGMKGILLDDIFKEYLRFPVPEYRSAEDLADSLIELPVLRGGHVVLDAFFLTSAHQASQGITAVHERALRKALALIRAHCHDWALALSLGVRRVMLFQAYEPNSFAALSAHGLVLFNVPVNADEVFFLEDMAHQGAHVLFNAMTLDKQRYLSIDPDTLVREQSTATDHSSRPPRSVYTVFHALATYMVIVPVLSRVLEHAGGLDARQRHELQGRLVYTLYKFRWDLSLLNNWPCLTARGRLIYRRMQASFDDHWRAQGTLVQLLDLSNQPYNFCYERFAQLNPLRVETSAGNAEKALA